MELKINDIFKDWCRDLNKQHQPSQSFTKKTMSEIYKLQHIQRKNIRYKFIENQGKISRK